MGESRALKGEVSAGPFASGLRTYISPRGMDIPSLSLLFSSLLFPSFHKAHAFTLLPLSSSSTSRFPSPTPPCKTKYGKMGFLCSFPGRGGDGGCEGCEKQGVPRWEELVREDEFWVFFQGEEEICRELVGMR